MLRWIGNHPKMWTGAVALGVLVLAAVVAIDRMPRDEPERSIAAAYAPLEESRLVRAGVRAEPKPPSVLERTGPAPEAEKPVFLAPVARLKIERIGIDAPFVTLGLTAQREMDSPKRHDQVGWYDFMTKPGLGGHAVVSGHVDYVNVGPAVFWNLRKLQPGDRVEIDLEDGTVLVYEVSAARLYPLAQVPMEEILAPTGVESLTLITCGGSFSAGEYDSRLIVRAAGAGVRKPG